MTWASGYSFPLFLVYPVDMPDLSIFFSTAIDKGVYYTTEAGPGLEILSTDVALLTLGTASRPPSVFPVPLSPLLEPVSSVAFNLYNNLWSTNYIYWYPFFAGDQNFKARFKINFV